jgi:hypothetical protein
MYPELLVIFHLFVLFSIFSKTFSSNPRYAESYNQFTLVTVADVQSCKGLISRDKHSHEINGTNISRES